MFKRVRKSTIFVLIVALLSANLCVYAAEPKYDTSGFERIDADCIYSIGPNCKPCENLKLNGLRSDAAPLDYMITPSLKMVLHLFETNFRDFFEEIEVIPDKFCGDCRHVKDTKNNLLSIHHFNKNTPIDQEHKKFRKTMLDRADRMRKTLEKSNSIALITSRSGAKLNELVDFMVKFDEIYGGGHKKLTLINIVNKDIDGIQQNVIYNKGNLKIVEFVFRDKLPKTDEFSKIPEWKGNTFAWKAALSCVRTCGGQVSH